MDDYTFDNVLIDPNKEGIESLIGKEVYFNDNPSYCLMHANEKSTNSLGVLVKIIKNSANPFRVEQNGTVYLRQCIIPKKGEPKPEPKYEPFKSVVEFLEGYSHVETKNLDNAHRYLYSQGIWLKEKETDIYYMVTEIRDTGVVVGNKKLSILDTTVFNDVTPWCELYVKYTFLDDSPCGKKV